MGQIYAGIDLGTNSIKIVVCEKFENTFHVLAAVSNKSMGIKNGQIVDTKMAVTSVRKTVKQINDMLGIKLTKVIAAVPPTDCNMDIVMGTTDVIDYDEITGEDVRNVLKDALSTHIGADKEIITACPINFTVDDEKNIKDPKGKAGKVLETKVVVSTLDKEPLYRILEVLKLSGLETVDVAFSSTGDYYTVKNKNRDNTVGAIINIGELTTNVSVYNKGIQIKNAVIPLGSINVDKDLSYVFKLSNEDCCYLKENFAVCVSSYADNNDVYDGVTAAGEKKEITQVGVSKVVEARIAEILNLAKNKIKSLTNREIHYIIITGGLSELAGFQYMVENIFGVDAKVCNISAMGIRHNKYSSVYGVIKYFDDKLNLRGKTYDMISENDREILEAADQKVAVNDNILSKVFGHFFDN